MQFTGARFHVRKIRKCESTEGRHMKHRLVDATPYSRLPPDPDVDDDSDGQSSSSLAMVFQLSKVKLLPSCTRQKARSNFSLQESAQGVKGFALLSEVVQQLNVVEVHTSGAQKSCLWFRTESAAGALQQTPQRSEAARNASRLGRMLTKRHRAWRLARQCSPAREGFAVAHGPCPGGSPPLLMAAARAELVSERVSDMSG